MKMKKIELDIARKLAWSFSRSTGLEYEELFAEACLGYAHALSNPRYDPTKSKFTSFAYWCIRSQLLTFVDRKKRTIYTTELKDNYFSKAP